MAEKNDEQIAQNDQAAVVEGEVVEEEEQVQAFDELAALQSKLEEAEAKAAEYLDGWQRSRAEFVNFKRRQEQLQQTMRQQATSRLIENLLPVLDDRERAFAAIPAEFGEHSWLKGLVLVDKKLWSALEKEGLGLMDVKPGDHFDPYYHQALLHEPSQEYDEGQIVDVLQKGYHLGESVLRPAIVRVSSGKRQEASSEV
ncbi:MAG: nucleotide exchange factor GrpE [Anaerolineae bacterium]|nr:nucleotide exchange factor GrpE [Anaerolineae bacterium]